MSIVYAVTCETLYAEETGRYETYGIEAQDPETPGKILARIPDIALKEDRVRRFVEQCNRGGLALCHLQDAVEDLLEQE